jgi:TM2 domain/Prokaryotic RING finger family 1
MSDNTACPYCRAPFDVQGPIKIFCPGCGVPHHEDCYQENGGCTVFGCSRAPADDPKLQVSSSEVNAVPYGAGYGLAPAMYGQPQFAVPAIIPKSRTAFVVLGVFLGAFGAHNFYAGYTGKAVGQLCLTLLSLFFLGIISWIWAMVEVCIINKDSMGVEFS